MSENNAAQSFTKDFVDKVKSADAKRQGDYIGDLLRIIALHSNDIEVLHGERDALLLRIIREELGYTTLATMAESLPGWYA